MSDDQTEREDVEANETALAQFKSALLQLISMGHDAMHAADFIHLHHMQTEGPVLVPVLINGHKGSAICVDVTDENGAKAARILFITTPPGIDIQVVNPITNQLTQATTDDHNKDGYKKSMQ